MKNRFFTLLPAVIFAAQLIVMHSAWAQSISRQVLPAAGGTLSVGGNTLSYTIGEPVSATFINGNAMLTQGFQQGEFTLVLMNVKAFIEGYYTGGGMMSQVMYNEGVDADGNSTRVDTVTIELHAADAPYDVSYSQTGVLQTNGSVTCKFPATALGSSYYIAVKHRNALQTWSADPVLLVSTNNYDFTTAASKAFGGNMIDPYGENTWCFYSGDINQDESIDIFDYPPLNDDIQNFIFGYYNTDLNGDGNSDIFDFPVLNVNISNFIFSNHPY